MPVGHEPVGLELGAAVVALARLDGRVRGRRAADLDAHRLERHRDVGARRVPRLLRVAEEAARAEGRVPAAFAAVRSFALSISDAHERAREAELARELDERVELA